MDRADENRRGSVIEPRGGFEHPRAVDVRGDDHAVPVLIDSFEFQAGVGAVFLPVLGRFAGVVKAIETPAGSDRVDEVLVAVEPGVGAVAAVEGDAFPIDEAAGARGGDPHRVVIVNHPRTALAHAAGAIVEADGDALLRDVSGRDLIGPEQGRTEVHALVGRKAAVFHLCRAAGKTLGQRGEGGGRKFGVLRRVVRAQEGLPDVVDDRVLLGGRVLRLGDHLVVALGQREIHRVGVRAVLELAVGESHRGGQRPRLLRVAVADDAERIVDRRAFFEGLRIPAADDFRVVGKFERLDPATAAFNNRPCIRVRPVGEVGRVRAAAILLEKQGDLVVRQYAFPNADRADGSFVEIAPEIRGGTADFQEVPVGILLREAVLLRDHLAIQPEAGSAAADGQHGGVRLAVVHPRPAVHRTKPANVIHKPAVFDVECLCRGRPIAGPGAHREKRAAALGLERCHRGEVRTEIEIGIGKLRDRGRGLGFRKGGGLFGSADKLAAGPYPQHRRAFRRMLDGDVVRSIRLLQGERKVVTQPDLGRTFEMKPVVRRPIL